MDVPKTLVAPIAKGQQIGTVKVTLDGKTIASAPLVAIHAVEEAGFFGRLWDAFWMWWESALGRAHNGASARQTEQRRVHPAAVDQLVVHLPHQPVLVAGRVEHLHAIHVANRAALGGDLLEHPP